MGGSCILIERDHNSRRLRYDGSEILHYLILELAMTALVLQDLKSGSRARLLPQLGFNCYSFEVSIAGAQVEVLDAEADFETGEKKGTRSGIPLLFPFPNRIQAGKFPWLDQSFELPGNDPHGNAIHGLVVDRPWRVAVADQQSALAEFQLSVDAPDRLSLWPADFLIQVRYSLQGNSLRSDIRIVNAGRVDLPWGFGTHPYFRTPLATVGERADCEVQVPAAERWELQEFIPTGRKIQVDERTDLRTGASLKDRFLDDVLTSLKPKNGIIETTLRDPHSGLTIHQRTGPLFRECVVFTPPNRSCVCIEPYTCTTNAINLNQKSVDAGLKILPPGQETSLWFEIQVEVTS